MKWVKTFEDFQHSGELIGKGEQHEVFLDVMSKDRVVKMGPSVIEHAKVFKKFPKYCPVVYETHVNKKNPLENYIVIEKLDTDKAKKDIYSVYNQLSNFSDELWHNKDIFNKELSSLKSQKDRDTFARMAEIILAIDMQDIHAENFGYDKNGKLKALDL